jgi:hypothetical protein
MYLTIIKIAIKNILLPIALKTVENYLSNDDNSQDSKLLDSVQKSIDYLAKKPNNTLNELSSQAINSAKMI